MDTTQITWTLGRGIGWRPQLDGSITHAGELGFVEVIAEALSATGLPDGVAGYQSPDRRPRGRRLVTIVLPGRSSHLHRRPPGTHAR